MYSIRIDSLLKEADVAFGVKFGRPGAQLGSRLYPQEQTLPAGRGQVRKVPSAEVRQRITLQKALYLTFPPLGIFLGDDIAQQRYALIADGEVLRTGNQLGHFALRLLTETTTSFRHRRHLALKEPVRSWHRNDEKYRH
jgi:hypothetical protein